jgi:hypothetical protein
MLLPMKRIMPMTWVVGAVSSKLTLMIALLVFLGFWLKNFVLIYLTEICSPHGLVLSEEKCRVAIGFHAPLLPQTIPFRQRFPNGDIVLGNPVETAEYRPAATRDLVAKYIPPLTNYKST